LGRNGAGKTTLVDILTNVTKPTSGSCKIRSKIFNFGICYQHEILYENLTVMEHLKFYAKIKNIKYEVHENEEMHIQEIVDTLAIQ
jgi:ATP-binding cassette subfamily A (ABC1) protein 3